MQNQDKPQEARAKRTLPDESRYGKAEAMIARLDDIAANPEKYVDPASEVSLARIAKWDETLTNPGDSDHAAQRRDDALAAMPEDSRAVAWNAWEERPLWREAATEEAAYGKAREACADELDYELRDEAEYAKMRGIYGLREDHDYYVSREDPAAFAERREELISNAAEGLRIASLEDIPSLNERDFGELATAFKANSHDVSGKVGDFVVAEMACRAAREREANRERSEPSPAKATDIER